MKTPSINDYASVEAICGGVPVYSFNHLVYVYGESPDFYPGAEYQRGNPHPSTKIRLKKLWEMKNNFMGFCHEMTPRTKWNDSQPFLPIHLIDGDPDTIWSSFECFGHDARAEWIRVDLPAETLVSKVKMTCKKRFMGKEKAGQYRPNWAFGCALPKEFSVKLSRDAWHWDEVYADFDLDPEADGVTVELAEPIPAKQILLAGNNFTKCGYEGYMWSISGVEVISPEGRNLALVSNGAGVTVSSTSDAHNTDRYSANSLWGPLQYDIGNKWTKVGSDNGSSMWCFTEHEKGKLEIDADFDAAITEAAGYGMNVKLTLDFKGNWAYDSPHKKPDWFLARFRELNDSYLGGVPLCDHDDEMYEGYLNWVSHMARHFKHKVAVFEVGNEWHHWHDSVDWYKNKIFEPTYDRIKAEAPEAGVVTCGVSGFRPEDILNIIDRGVMAAGGALWAKNRALLNVRDLSVGDADVRVKAKCEALSGIVLKFKHRENFLAAIYDPKAGEIFFIESAENYRMNHNYDVVSQCKKKNAVACKMGFVVTMEAASRGKRVTFTVSDGAERVSTEYETEKLGLEGGVGLLHYPEEAGGEFFEFLVTDPEGHPIFAGEFDDVGEMAKKWELHWNHWDDGKKPILATRLAGIGWHAADVPDTAYFDRVRSFRKECEKLGFFGQYFVNEIYAGAGYPPGPVEGNIFRLTDMQEAKYYICTMVGYSGLNIESGPCHVHFTGFPHPQSACRTTVPSQVLAPSQPKPTYYAIRNASTIMDDFYEADFPAEFADGENGPEIVRFTLKSGDGGRLMVAAYLSVPMGEMSDLALERQTSLSIDAKDAKDAKDICSASVFDVFNGTEQELNIKTEDGKVVIDDILVKDYPLFFVLKGK